jgi:hypothetical protein
MTQPLNMGECAAITDGNMIRWRKETGSTELSSGAGQSFPAVRPEPEDFGGGGKLNENMEISFRST